MIKIFFGKSTSQNYSLAVKRAKRDATHYEEETIGKTISHKVGYDFGKIQKVYPLWDLVKGWKTTQLFINDELADVTELKNYN